MKTRKLYFFLICFFSFSLNFNHTLSDIDVALLGKNDSRVTVKVFSSLTCPHCASFHKKIFNNLKEDYNNTIRFEHHGFPLDLAALNAEKVLNCFKNKEKKIDFLNEIYEKQDDWTNAADINNINSNLIKIAKKHSLKNDMINKCLGDESLEDEILNKRIMAQKKYFIESTPTIFINEKQYTGKHNYKDFKKKIEIEIK